MLHFRNTYKNCKIMLLYAFVTIVSLITLTISLMFAFIPEFRVVAIIIFIISTILFVFNFFLLCMKNNNYQFKNYFKLGKFNKEFKKFENLCQGNKKRIKEIKKLLKDHFLQFGEVCLNAQTIESEKNNWNNWIEDTSAFNYGYSGYMEKLSYLTYVLYNACAGGGGLEEFFQWISYEPFTKEEIISIFTKNEFFNIDFKNFLVKIIKEFDKEKQDELFARYEFEDNKIFFTFENEISDYANWLAYNRTLLSTSVGLTLHGNIDFNMYKLYLSYDYKKIIYIYGFDNNIKVRYMTWNEYNTSWDLMQDSDRSIYDTVETAINDIKHLIKDYIEISI